MKKWVLMLLALPALGWGATSVTMDGPMTDSNAALGVSGSTVSYTLNTDDHNIDVLSIQMLYSSAVYTNAAFNDGRASSATITVNSFAGLSTAPAHGTLTVGSNTSLEGVEASTSILISSNVTGTRITITGPPANMPNVITIGGNVAPGTTSTNTATNIGVFWSSVTSNGLFRSSVSGSSVTLTFVSSGTFGNAYAITSSSQAAISSGTFVSGVNPATVTVAGAILRANKEWNVGASVTETASNIAASINLLIGTNTAVGQPIIATNTAGVVAATAAFNGSAGNLMPLSSGNGNITVSGATFLGGQDNAVLIVNGTSVTANNAFYPITSNSITATAIATAWNSTVGSQTVTMGSQGAVIGATSTAVGSNTTYATQTSTQGALTLGPFTSSSPVTGLATGTMVGGLGSSFTITGANLTIPSHGIPTALGVWVSSVSGTSNLTYSTASVGGTSVVLGQGTTYYVIPVNANTIQLALTSTGAVAGAGVFWSSSQTKTTTDTYTLNVPVSSGTASFGFWSGNDGVNFQQTISTQSIVGPPWTSSTTFYDPGSFDWKYLQLRVTPPTVSGGLAVKALIHGEKR